MEVCGGSKRGEILQEEMEKGRLMLVEVGLMEMEKKIKMRLEKEKKIKK